jgi:hypothetical protein
MGESLRVDAAIAELLGGRGGAREMVDVYMMGEI